jgi:hypothetical protein
VKVAEEVLRGKIELQNFSDNAKTGNTKGGSITVLLTSCLTGLESAVQLLTNFYYLQNRLIHNSQTGGQWYSVTSPFSIPWPKYHFFPLPFGGLT